MQETVFPSRKSVCITGAALSPYNRVYFYGLLLLTETVKRTFRICGMSFQFVEIQKTFGLFFKKIRSSTLSLLRIFIGKLFKLKRTCIEPVVLSPFGNELFVASALDNASLFKNHYNVGVLYG